VHAGAFRRSNREGIDIESIETEYVHAKVTRGGAFTMKNIDPAAATEVVFCAPAVPFIQGE
jgi:hypothetical protein